MIRGIHFEIVHQRDENIKNILENVNVEQFCWTIHELDLYEAVNQEAFDCKMDQERITGADFRELILSIKDGVEDVGNRAIASAIKNTKRKGIPILYCRSIQRSLLVDINQNAVKSSFWRILCPLSSPSVTIWHDILPSLDKYNLSSLKTKIRF